MTEDARSEEDAVDTSPMSDADEQADSTEKTTGLIVYCRSWCGDCRRAKAWLDELGIPYEEVDVDVDPEARERAAALNEGRLHTPTFERGEDFCVDFRPERLRELLDLG